MGGGFAATVLPNATEISWPFASWVKYIFSRAELPWDIDCSFPLTFIIRGDAYPMAKSTWTQLTISLANFGSMAHPLAGL